MKLLIEKDPPLLISGDDATNFNKPMNEFVDKIKIQLLKTPTA